MDIYSKFDFYSPFNLSEYSFGKSMRYQLSLLDNLDFKTKRHSQNVANVTGRICEYLGCKPEFTFYAVMCAYLHDIGKTFIPKSILFKDGRLTDEEYEIIKQHTTYGYNLCINDPKLKMFAEGTLYHHECLDGSGYPNGVKGKDIPYASQIIHVADVYDALVTKRHYTTHVNISDTLNVLVKDSEPSKNMVAFDELSRNYQVGKINKTALNALFKVVIDDTNFEIASTKKYIKALKNDVKGLRIGVPKEFFGEGIQDDVKEQLQNAIETYKQLGAKVEECSLDIAEYALATYYIIACAETSSNLGRFDGIRYGYRAKYFTNLKELYRKSRTEAFGEEVKRRIILGTYVLSSGYYDAYYKKAQKVRTFVKKQFDEKFKKYDVLLTPVAPTTAFEIESKSNNPIEMYLADICTVSINIASLPAISIPCGVDKNGMSVGMQLIGDRFSEAKLLNAAYTFEQKIQFKQNHKPEFKK